MLAQVEIEARHKAAVIVLGFMLLFPEYKSVLVLLRSFLLKVGSR